MEEKIFFVSVMHEFSIMLYTRCQDNGNIITSALSVMNGGVVDSLTNVFSDNSISCLDNFNSLQTGGGGNLTDLSVSSPLTLSWLG